MIAAQQIGFASDFTGTEWLLTIALISAVTLILVMANRNRVLTGQRNRARYESKVLANELEMIGVDADGVMTIRTQEALDPVDEVGAQADVDQFFENHPGVDPMAKRNR